MPVELAWEGSVKRLVLVAALAAGCLVPGCRVGGGQADPRQRERRRSYCIAVDNGPTAVTFTVRAPGGAMLDEASHDRVRRGELHRRVDRRCRVVHGGRSTTTPGATRHRRCRRWRLDDLPDPLRRVRRDRPASGIVKIENLPSAARAIATITAGRPRATPARPTRRRLP